MSHTASTADQSRDTRKIHHTMRDRWTGEQQAKNDQHTTEGFHSSRRHPRICQTRDQQTRNKNRWNVIYISLDDALYFRIFFLVRYFWLCGVPFALCSQHFLETLKISGKRVWISQCWCFELETFQSRVIQAEQMIRVSKPICLIAF